MIKVFGCHIQTCTIIIKLLIYVCRIVSFELISVSVQRNIEFEVVDVEPANASFRVNSLV